MKGDMPIGIDRRVQLTWLESTASLHLAGASPVQISAALHDMIGDKLSSNAPGGRGAMEKTVTILLRTWDTTPRGLRQFRDDGLTLLKAGSSETRMAVHWGMIMTVYPFWGSVAETTGKLLKLQGSASMKQILLRVKEQLGERQTVTRAAQRVMRSFVDWGVLKDVQEKGVYTMAPKIVIKDAHLSAWLAEAVLRSSGTKSALLNAIIDSNAVFPFRIEAPYVSKSTVRTEIHRLGIDEDTVVLRDSID